MDAKSKLASIKSDSDTHTGKYSDEFIEALEVGIIRILDNEIEMHIRHGVSDSELGQNASAAQLSAMFGGRQSCHRYEYWKLLMAYPFDYCETRSTHIGVFRSVLHCLSDFISCLRHSCHSLA